MCYEDAINFINTIVIPHPWFKAICLNGQPIGAISVTKNSDNNKCRGLEAIVDAENVGSQRVLEKVGFQREGVLRMYMILKGKTRDLVMFSLLSSDPKS
ncbi:hypothetical protein ACB092_04G132700 [Castanea dentata]